MIYRVAMAFVAFVLLVSFAPQASAATIIPSVYRVIDKHTTYKVDVVVPANGTRVITIIAWIYLDNGRRTHQSKEVRVGTTYKATAFFYVKHKYYCETGSRDECSVSNIVFQVNDPSGPGGRVEYVHQTPGGDYPGGTDPGGSDPGGTDPGGSDPGGTDPGGSNPGGTNPGGTDPGTDPGGSNPGTDPDGTDPGGIACNCCEAVGNMLAALNEAAEEQGYKLDDISYLLADLGDMVYEQGYKLDDMLAVLEDVSDKMDTANRHLANIEDQVTPKGTYDIDVPNWDSLMRDVDVPYLGDVERVRDRNVYFADPGEGDPVPRMPDQPDINFPVPIGESLQRESPLLMQPPISPDSPRISHPVMRSDPAKNMDAPMQADPVRRQDQMQLDPIRQVDRMQLDPIRQVDRMQLDPVRERDAIMVDPVRERTHIYERQAVPNGPN